MRFFSINKLTQHLAFKSGAAFPLQHRERESSLSFWQNSVVVAVKGHGVIARLQMTLQAWQVQAVF